MRIRLLILALSIASAVFAAGDAQSVIQHTLEKQVDDWNRADIPAFVAAYAEDCVFVGQNVVQGRQRVEERYKKTYANAEAMGHLAFTNLKIKTIDKQVATVTGEFHLTRSQAGGGEKSGIFSLVMVRHGGIWQIALDHTS